MTDATLAYRITAETAAAVASTRKMVEAFQQLGVAVKATGTISTSASALMVNEQRAVANATEIAARKVGTAWVAEANASAAAFDQLRTSLDGTYANSKRYEAAVLEAQRAVQVGTATQEEANRVLALAEARYLGVGAAATTSSNATALALTGVGRGAGMAAANVGNLAAQFNDIGVMMAAGQNPLIMAIQQGTQISQVLGPMGAGGAVKSLGAAFVSMINPVSLGTIAIIAGGAALVQWGIKALSAFGDGKFAADEMADANSRLGESISALRGIGDLSIQALIDKYGEADAALLSLIEHQRLQVQTAAMTEAKAAISGLTGEYGGLLTAIDIQSRAGIQAVQKLKSELGLSAQEGRALRTALEDASAATTFAEASDALSRVDAILATTKISTGEFATAVTATALSLREVETAATGAANGVAAAAVAADALGQIPIAGEFVRAHTAALALFAEIDRSAVGARELHEAVGGVGAMFDDATSAIAAMVAAQPGEGWLTTAIARAGTLAATLWNGAMAAKAAADVQVASAPGPRVGGGRLEDSQYSLAGQNAIAADRLALLIRPTNLPSGGVGTGADAGSSGGGPASGSLDALQAEARKALDTMGLAVAGINEKVQLGLMTTAEGVAAIAGAKDKTANALADLIPEIQAAFGPKSVALVASLRAAINDMADGMSDVGRKLSDGLSKSFEGSFASFLDGTKSAKESFNSMAQSIISDIAKIAAQRFTAKFIAPLFDGLISMFGFAQGGVPGVEAFAKGGLPGLSHFSDSVVSHPTLFEFAQGKTGVMGEAGSEAILPLRQGPGGMGVLATGPDGSENVIPLKRGRGGALGVQVPDWRPEWLDGPEAMFGTGATFRGGRVIGTATGGSAGGMSDRAGGGVVINVTNNAPNVKARAAERTEGNKRIIDVMVEQILGAVAGDIAHGGPVSDAMTGNFGLQRMGR